MLKLLLTIVLLVWPNLSSAVECVDSILNPHTNVARHQYSEAMIQNYLRANGAAPQCNFGIGIHTLAAFLEDDTANFDGFFSASLTDAQIMEVGTAMSKMHGSGDIPVKFHTKAQLDEGIADNYLVSHAGGRYGKVVKADVLIDNLSKADYDLLKAGGNKLAVSSDGNGGFKFRVMPFIVSHNADETLVKLTLIQNTDKKSLKLIQRGSKFVLVERGERLLVEGDLIVSGNHIEGLFRNSVTTAKRYLQAFNMITVDAQGNPTRLNTDFAEYDFFKKAVIKMRDVLKDNSEFTNRYKNNLREWSIRFHEAIPDVQNGLAQLSQTYTDSGGIEVTLSQVRQGLADIVYTFLRESRELLLPELERDPVITDSLGRLQGNFASDSALMTRLQRCCNISQPDQLRMSEIFTRMWSSLETIREPTSP